METGGSQELHGSIGSSRFIERPCLEIVRQRIIDQKKHPAFSSGLYTYAWTQVLGHTGLLQASYTYTRSHTYDIVIKIIQI